MQVNLIPNWVLLHEKFLWVYIFNGIRMSSKIVQIILITLFGLTFSFQANGQRRDTTRIGLGVITQNDTIIHQQIPEVWVYPRRDFKSPRYERQYWRLVQRVKKVMPYAREANRLLRQYEPEYVKLTNDRDKRRLIKKVEEELMKQYKEELKKLTIQDGKVLIKLIDRETGRTGYTLIREFRGAVIATFWQGIARLFGNNLKDEFDAWGEDMLLEEIITLIEIGYL